MSSLIKFISGLLLLIASPWLSAANSGFLTGAGLQWKNLKMEQDFKGVSDLGSNNSGDLTAAIAVLNLQGIAFYENFYSVLKLELGLTDEAFDSGVPYTSDGSNLDTRVTRNDMSIAFGYKLNHSLSVFAGYMQGETELTPETNACDDVLNCQNSASVMKSNGFGEYQQNYEEKGFFIGTSFAWDVAHGKISTSLAYALMDGQYTDNYQDNDGPQKFKYEGDSKGLSLAGSWAAPLTENTTYFIDARLQQYRLSADDKSGLENFAGSRVETTETLLGITGGIQWFF